MITIAYLDDSCESAEQELARFADGLYTVSLTPDHALMAKDPAYLPDLAIASTGPRDVRILEVVTGDGFQWYGSVRVVNVDDNGQPAGDPYVVVVDRVELY